MKLFDLGFLSVRVLDMVDIILVALLIYGLFKIVRGSIALNVFVGFLVVYVIYLIVRATNMQLLTTILGNFMEVGIVALLIVFQQEIRRFLLMVGKN
ncbi:MAG: TIGR00159 family protein, partial [Bacteroidota bacterium]|nr:TIGR00159 family protein [Bacteroidota bacterium]